MVEALSALQVTASSISGSGSVPLAGLGAASAAPRPLRQRGARAPGSQRLQIDRHSLMEGSASEDCGVVPEGGGEGEVPPSRNAIQAASDRIKHFDSIFGPAPQGAYRFIVLRSNL